MYALVTTLSAFTLKNLSPVEQDKAYLKILLSQYAQKGKLLLIVEMGIHMKEILLREIKEKL